MSRKQTIDLAASVRQRLLNVAKARSEELQLVLTRYGVERLLYRLSKTPAAERFVLKGAVLFYLWEGVAGPTDRNFVLATSEVPQASGHWYAVCGSKARRARHRRARTACSVTRHDEDRTAIRVWPIKALYVAARQRQHPT